MLWSQFPVPAHNLPMPAINCLETFCSPSFVVMITALDHTHADTLDEATFGKV